ncbi:MAG: Holliday junction branch migration DNA helicase RuvB [Candidatus Aminicenantes bacterium]|nr:Holliday junction branch migration DNA helicase RuvB [Candidatus Aminicenantes bacterium]NIM85095.1 Holliday junction branch migration DNA helicase RuvB [Candidatus Aminicenantes bacterium]NIN24602.1 Holliday junction branch migration DNA helicase RuvB [Candidatus Aminicenantes bacterium]NIN48366.1 Holliday junction branch migration DNA helicase RuvB [Candidatus Aminicenantes bacterium]NIN91269.1 Holliday junction branch migration DNA helicase RuvB [Candidatus Aminicenantes bacterium]
MAANTEESEKTTADSQEDLKFERNLRPSFFDEFIGQKQRVENLKTYVQGAKQRNESLDHVLLHGPPGLGKTTIAHIIAKEIGVNIRSTSGPILERKGDLTAILTDLEPHDVLFIDEIHRLKTSLEEILYKAMEDFQLDIIIGQGVGAKNISIDINHFTLIGATTRAGLLSSPLRDRFGIMMHLDFYNVDELIQVLIRSAGILKIKIYPKAAESIARRSRGTPRVANKLLKRVRDFAQVEGEGVIDPKITDLAFRALEVDEEGFDQTDRKILLTIIDHFAGGPVGLSTLSTSIQEEKDTLLDVYEPYLIQQGFLKITPRGRVATEKAFKYFKRELPDLSGSQRSLF